MNLFKGFADGDKRGGRKRLAQGAHSKKSGEHSDMDRVLLRFSPHDTFTLGNAVEAVAIFGEIGAGKTTGFDPTEDAAQADGRVA